MAYIYHGFAIIVYGDAHAYAEFVFQRVCLGSPRAIPLRKLSRTPRESNTLSNQKHARIHGPRRLAARDQMNEELVLMDA